MRQMVQKEIDGQKYNINPMAPTKAVKLISRIMKLVGGSASAKAGDGIETQDIAAKLLERLDEELVLNIVKDSLDGVNFIKPEGDSEVKFIKAQVADIIDAHFGQFPLTHLFKVVWASLEVNFGDFFGESGGLGNMLSKVTSLQAK